MTVSLQKKTAKAKSFDIMLGNDCQRFVRTSDQKLFESGVRYSVSEKERKELFAELDDFGVPYFYDAEVIERQMAAKQRKQQERDRIEQGLSPRPARSDRGRRSVNEEVDTGAMSLKDSKGQSVGTVEV